MIYYNISCPAAPLGFPLQPLHAPGLTANLRTKIMDFRGFDASRILILRGGIPRPIGDFPESLSRAILLGIILVGRLGVISPTTSSKEHLESQKKYLDLTPLARRSWDWAYQQPAEVNNQYHTIPSQFPEHRIYIYIYIYI